MANDIRILYLEDNDSDYEYFEIFMTQVLSTLGNPQFVRAEAPEEACRMLQDSGQDYDLFLTDLLFPDKSKPGQRHSYRADIAIREAAKRDGLAIIALSIAKKEEALIEEDFRKDGGHVFLEKNAISVERRLRPADVLEKILPVLKQKNVVGRSPGPSLDWKEGEHIQVDAVVEMIGKDIFEGILREVESEPIRFVPHYVAPGWSGAVVVRVDGFKEHVAHPDVQMLLKLSRDAEKLCQELQNGPRRRDVEAHLYVPYENRAPVTRGGWFAIGARFEDQARSFNEWLSEAGVTAKEIKVLLEELFLEGLTKKYKAGRHVDESALGLLRPNLLNRARILNGSPLLRDLISKTLSVDAMTWDIVENFIHFPQVGTRSFESVTKGTFICVCHGDLHGRNILVTVPHDPGPSPRAWLIDPAHRREKHWASDLAKLCADLWVSVWAGAVESHRWDELYLWRNDVQSWAKGKKVSIPADRSVNKNAFAALSWIRDNLGRIIGGNEYAKPWEFRAALVVEFLEASSYVETAAPKRCLSLLAAHDLLVQLEGDLPRKLI